MGWCTGSIGQCVAGSSPACLANAKAMCGAWLGAYALPGRLDPVNLHKNSLFWAPRKDGAAAGGIPLPRGLSSAFLFAAQIVKQCSAKNRLEA